MSQLETGSLGLITVEELLADSKWKAYAKNGFLLGVDTDPYSQIAQVLKMTSFRTAYEDLEIKQIVEAYEYREALDVPDHVEIFMDKIRQEKIVFLIPRRFLQYQISTSQSDFGDKDITKREFKWLLRRPSNRNVVFVLGAYDFLPEGIGDKNLKKLLRSPTQSQARTEP